MDKYCSNCGAYVGFSTPLQRCNSCSHMLNVGTPQVVIPQGLNELATALGHVSTVAAVNVFTNLWNLATEEQKAEVVGAYVARSVQRVADGHVDENIKGLVAQLVKSVDSPTFFAEESRAVLAKAFAARLETQLTDPSSKAYGHTGQAMLQDSVLLSSIAEASKKVAAEYMPHIENLIRDRLAANLDKIVDDAVKKVAADALANVQVKKA